jgi:5-methylcytosine-specific restriction endonuclease McrA
MGTRGRTDKFHNPGKPGREYLQEILAWYQARGFHTPRTMQIPLPDFRQQRRCVWCGGSLARRQQRWCSQACVEDYQVRRGQASEIRKLVFRRDRGACRACGVQTEDLRQRVEEFFHAVRQGQDIPRDVFWSWMEFLRAWLPQRDQAVARALLGAFAEVWDTVFRVPSRSKTETAVRYYQVLGPWAYLILSKTTLGLWEADHHLPVHLGGGAGCSLENLHTLCYRCHRAKSVTENYLAANPFSLRGLDHE